MLRKLFILFLISFLAAPVFVKPASAQTNNISLYLPAVFNTYPLILKNGDFEAGNISWVETATHNVRIIVNANDEVYKPPVFPWNGQWMAWLGGVPNSTQSISQQVFINPELPHLAYYQLIGSKEPEDDCTNDTARVLVNAQPVASYFLCETSEKSGWELVSHDLSDYAGQTVTVAIEVITNNNDLNSNLFIDGVSFLPDPAP